MPFIALPQEILIHTLSHLDHRSILSCASTCRLLYETCKDSLELQYLIELAIDGFKKPITNASHSELISRLRGLRLSWANLDCKRFKKVELSNLCMAYELIAGVFAMSDGHKLNFTWLPSSTMNGRSLTYPSLEFRIIDFAMDPTQDLIVILEDHNSPIAVTDTRNVRLHIRSISAANDVHPLASEGILNFDVFPHEVLGNTVSVALIEIAIDIVAVYCTRGFPPSHPRILLWNWHNGILIYDSDTVGPPLPSTGVQHFSLLTRSAFILTLTSLSGSLQLYTFSPTSPSLAPASLCCTLHLPPIQPHCSLFELRAYSGPISAGQPDPFTFTNDTEEHIILVSLFYTVAVSGSDDAPQSTSYRLYVHKRTFLDYITRFHRRDAEEGVENAHTAADVDWDDWGERNTRFMRSPSSIPWLRYVHGARVIIKYRGRAIKVLNFNIPSCTSLSLSPSPSPSPSLSPSSTFSSPSSSSISLPTSEFKFELHNEPTTNYPTHLFQKDFITRLPYYSTTRVIKVEESEESFFACMIDEERVIGISMSGRDKMILHVCAF